MIHMSISNLSKFERCLLQTVLQELLDTKEQEVLKLENYSSVLKFFFDQRYQRASQYLEIQLKTKLKRDKKSIVLNQKKEIQNEYLQTLNLLKTMNEEDKQSPIIEGLFLGNIEGRRDISLLKKNKIKLLVILDSYDQKYLKNPYILDGNAELMYIRIKDTKESNIKQYFNQAHQIINKFILSKSAVLVACMAGRSRSASIVISYLMFSKKWSFKQAFEFVKKKRKEVFPNEGFIEQLKQFEIEMRNEKEITVL